VLMIAHYRHVHTSYDAELAEHRSERYKRYRELREEGYDFDLAWMIVDDELPPKTDEEIRNIKAEYNKEAIKLLKEDGLL